eukprot:scaffold4654_cov123-Skeletonema_menzelii.AAC.4
MYPLRLQLLNESFDEHRGAAYSRSQKVPLLVGRSSFNVHSRSRPSWAAAATAKSRSLDVGRGEASSMECYDRMVWMCYKSSKIKAAVHSTEEESLESFTKKYQNEILIEASEAAIKRQRQQRQQPHCFTT